MGKTSVLKISKDNTPKGVSFSPSIPCCLEGVPFYYTRKIDWKKRKEYVKKGDNNWYVYTPIKPYIGIKPTRKQVDDVERTREIRVLQQVKVVFVKKIIVGIKNNKWVYKQSRN